MEMVMGRIRGTSGRRSAATKIGGCSLLLLALAGCSIQVDCNASNAKDSVLKIVESHLGNASWFQDIRLASTGSPELRNVKVTSSNDQTKQASCAADYAFDYNGKPRELEVAYSLTYLHDKKDVEVKVAIQGLRGNLVALAGREPPIRNGTQKVLDPKTGALLHKFEWKNGAQDGLQESYDPASGKVVGQLQMAGGKKDGAEKRWAADGSTLLVDLVWKDGKPTGFEKHFDAQGMLITDLTWKDGLATGFLVEGKTGPSSTGYTASTYKDGKLDGVQKVYLANRTDGKLYLLYAKTYKDGSLDGVTQEFTPNGDVISTKTFRDGKEVTGG